MGLLYRFLKRQALVGVLSYGDHRSVSYHSGYTFNCTLCDAEVKDRIWAWCTVASKIYETDEISFIQTVCANCFQVIQQRITDSSYYQGRTTMYAESWRTSPSWCHDCSMTGKVLTTKNCEHNRVDEHYLETIAD